MVHSHVPLHDWPMNKRMTRRRKTVLTAVIVLLALLGLYSAATVRFLTAPYRVRSNVCEQVRAQCVGTDGAPGCIEAMNDLCRGDASFDPPSDSPLFALWPNIEPGDAEWKAFVFHVEGESSRVQGVQAACGRAHLGDSVSMIGHGLSCDSSWFVAGGLGRIRGAVRLLTADAIIAGSQQQHGRVVANIEAMCSLADRTSLPEEPTHRLLAGAILVQAAGLVRRLGAGNASGPALLQEVSNEHLERMHQALQASANATLTCSPAFHRMTGDDYIQHIFSDDGKGNGVFGWRGYQWVRRMEDQSGVRARGFATDGGPLLPINAQLLPDRKSVQMYSDKVQDSLRQWCAEPYWLRTQPAFLRQPPGSKVAKLCLAPTEEAVLLESNAIARCSMIRAAAVIAITAEQYRRATGGLPTSLEQIGLAPEFTVDLFTGEQLLLQARGTSVMVYSRGQDRDNDGGREADESSAAGTWIEPAHLREAVDGDFVLWPVPK